VDYITKPANPVVRVRTHLAGAYGRAAPHRLEIVQRLGLAAEYKDNEPAGT
jgi:putative two-component system response regulator